ncbi:MAG: phage tail family protein [Lachnospiraceae bacterium]|nr:phage tail family protein [Lachnospiraceae bacterium]
MVTDRRIIISRTGETLALTETPFSVEEIKGFDSLDVNVVTTQGFDQDGSTPVNIYTDDRPMEIKGQIYAESTWKMQELRDRLLDIFLPKAALEVRHYYGGVARTIRAYAEKTPAFTLTKVSKLQEYRVKLRATEPYWRGDRDAMVEMAGTKGQFHFPLVIPRGKGVIFGVKSKSKIASVPNRSAIRTGMEITFTARGNVTNPYVINIYTRECIQINCGMVNGQTITVQTGEEKTITSRLNGVSTDYIGRVDLEGGNCDFLELAPGDNVLRYGAEEGEDYLAVKFVYATKYAGV